MQLKPGDGADFVVATYRLGGKVGHHHHRHTAPLGSAQAAFHCALLWYMASHVRCANVLAMSTTHALRQCPQNPAHPWGWGAVCEEIGRRGGACA